MLLRLLIKFTVEIDYFSCYAAVDVASVFSTTYNARR